ncbi:MAG: hypothetical protein ACYTFZ_07000 [Planctomycetota bacterium]|jgi:hypothetical protein
MMFCLPVALAVGIAGIVVDERKWLAILVTVLAGGGVLLFFLPVLLFVFCA